MYSSNKTAFSTTYQASQAIKRIIFVDYNVQDYQYFVRSALANIPVKILDSERDGIWQITQYLSQNNYSEVNIIAHGSPGCLYLGNTQLSLKTLEEYTNQLKSWSVASILIYGCNVAAGETGLKFFEKLHQFTGTKIAASAHKVGHSTLGGTWELDVKTSDFNVDLPFETVVKTQWNHVLEPFESQPAFYQVIGVDTNDDDKLDKSQLKLLNPLTGQYEDIGAVQDFYNGTGFNRQDNYIYGVGTAGTIANQIIQIQSDGSIVPLKNANNQTINLPTPATKEDYNAGDVDNNNNLWVRLKKDNNTSLIKIDLTGNNPPATITFNDSSSPKPNNVADLVFVPSGNSGILYGVENNILYAWDLNTIQNGKPTLTSKQIKLIDDQGQLTNNNLPNGAYGAAWTDIDGNLYVSNNLSGSLYRIDNYTSDKPGAKSITDTDPVTINDGVSDPTQLSPFVIPLIDLDGDNSSGVSSPNYETNFTENSDGIGIVEPDATTDNDPTTDETKDIIIKDFDTPNQIITATITLKNTKDGDEFVIGDLPAGITSSKITDSDGNIVLTLSAISDIVPEDWELALEAIRFNNTSDTPDTEPRQVEIVLTDADNHQGNTATTTINIETVNDNPSFNGLDGTPTFNTGQNPVVLDADATITDPELDNIDNYDGATLTLQRNGGANPDDVFSNSGTLGALTEGGNLVLNGVTVGTVTTNSGGTLTLEFDGNATGDLVDQVLQQITYSNTSATPPTSLQIDYTVNDGNTGSQGTGGALTASGSVTVNITTNNLPTSEDKTVTTDEDSPYIFSENDFPFTDIDTGDSLQTVKITSLPTNGKLQLNGEDITTLNTEISLEDIQSGKLTFVPDADENGTGYADFNFQVGDGEGFSSDNTITIDVTPQNDIPTSEDKTVTTDEDSPYIFSENDFPFTDIDTGDSLQTVKITSLPTNGKLQLNGEDITTLNTEISLEDIQSGKLTFVPDADENGTGYADFNFQVGDGEGFSSDNTITIDVTPQDDTTNNPPTVSDNSVRVNDNSQDNELGITAPTDPDNDSLTITVTTLPNLGTITKADGTPVNIGDTLTPEELAGLLYDTPENYSGTDELGTFSYNVSDGVNTVPGSVNIDIISPETDTDGDGIPDINDLDDDNDGIFDTNEGDGDTDGDGIPDIIDLDSDNDGVPDLNESGLTPDQINQLDSDGDGVIDPANDFGTNGVIDSLETTPDSGELDLNGDGQPDDPLDTDKDGVPDFQDLDSDNDSIPDVLEAGGTDTDGDGLIDGANTDTDGDGLADAVDPDNGGTAVAIPDIDNDGVADFRDLDSDNDGISDLIEGGQDPAVVDTDGNGIIDGSDSDGDGILDVIDDNDGFSDANTDPLPDADGDGTPDYQEIDSDNDGTPDRVEAGLPTGEGTPDVDGDGLIDDPTDTDGDGVPDSIDTLPDGDGGFETPTPPTNQPPTVASNSIRVDVTSDNNSLGLGIPTDPENDNLTITISSIPTLGTISKADGTVVNIGDSLTPEELEGLVYNAPDSYNGSDDLGEFGYEVSDGVNPPVSGTVEIAVVNPDVDSDGDGVPDINDLDDDNDGVLDIDEGEGDKDGDNIPNVLDLDSDNDSIPDLYESGLPQDQAGQLDTDGDGVIDPTNDFGNNGFVDSLENPPESGQVDYNGDGETDTPVDTDEDNISDFQDLDSDNDGINDVIEAGGTDTDNDGLADSVDPDNGGTANIPPDNDNDGVADFRDLDSDNDGINDVIEGGSPDPDGDGVIGGEDSDNDGIPDTVDNNNGGFGNSGGTPTPDTDSDGSPDYLDLDSDNDGLNDIEEVGLTDPDGDGRLDAEDTDSDGIPNAVDNNNGGFGNSETPPLPDTDGDGIPDFRDVETPVTPPAVPQDNAVPVPTVPVDNKPPVAVDDTPNTPQDSPVVIDVLENDKDDSPLNPDSVVVVSEPDQGTLVNNQNGTLTYTPNPEYIGSDTFSYTVQDQEGNLSNIATVTITVNAQGTIDTECCQCPEPPQPENKVLPTPPEITASNLNSTDNADLLVGTLNNDLIAASAGDDTIVSGEGNNLNHTGNGNDLAFSSTGDDTLHGELGRDTLIAGPSGLEPIGQNGDQDVLFGDENDDWLVGSFGHDILHSGQHNDEAFGGKDDDWVMGERGNDTLYGDMGDDTVLGGTNNLPEDSPRDAFGEDWLFGGEGNDFMDGNEANDTLVAGEGDDTVHGGKENDWLWGETGNDMMFGDIGNDSLCAGEGNDTLRGDQIDNGNSPSVGANGQQDKLSGGAGNDLLFGDEGQDTLCGGEDNDTLHGGKDDDLLKGCSGDDLLLGEMGNDSLVGGSGNDTLTGGEGNNYFVLELNSGSDVITDFQLGQDKLVLAEGLTLSRLQINAEGDNAVISLDSEIIATLLDVDATAIMASDILI